MTISYKIKKRPTIAFSLFWKLFNLHWILPKRLKNPDNFRWKITRTRPVMCKPLQNFLSLQQIPWSLRTVKDPPSLHKYAMYHLLRKTGIEKNIFKFHNFFTENFQDTIWAVRIYVNSLQQIQFIFCNICIAGHYFKQMNIFPGAACHKFVSRSKYEDIENIFLPIRFLIWKFQIWIEWINRTNQSLHIRIPIQ